MMELGTSEPSSYPAESGDCHIPIDLFGSKKHAGVPRGVLSFADASGNVVFRVNPHSSHNKLLLDASANPLLSIHRLQVNCETNPRAGVAPESGDSQIRIPDLQNGCWKCYKGDNNEKDLVFRVQRTSKTLTRVELDVFFKGDKLEDGGCDLKVRGSPFQRSCNIYKDTHLVAQTSLMYKLHQLYVSRGKFRLTIFPGTIDHALIVALFVIFLNGRK